MDGVRSEMGRNTPQRFKDERRTKRMRYHAHVKLFSELCQLWRKKSCVI